MDDPGLRALRIAGMKEDIMLVGHLPYMARLAGLLLSGYKEKTMIDLKAGIAALKELTTGGGR